jgi:hypothetical protein
MTPCANSADVAAARLSSAISEQIANRTKRVTSKDVKRNRRAQGGYRIHANPNVECSRA